MHLVAQWLRSHSTWNVNAGLPSVPGIPGARTAPALVAVLASTSDEAAALGMVTDGQALPVLVVTPNDEPVAMMNPATLTGPRDYLVPVLVRYVTRTGETAVAPDTAVAECDTDSTLRAVVRSLSRLTREGTPADKETGGVAIWSLQDISLASLWDTSGDVAITGGVVARFRVRDTFVE